ncbi:hypothetical protein RBI14_17055 [Alcaligenaceae bacterium B3P038]|nr:hypothetical protein [Alcaligenaceae bacterium B3P038]
MLRSPANLQIRYPNGTGRLSIHAALLGNEDVAHIHRALIDASAFGEACFASVSIGTATNVDAGRQLKKFMPIQKWLCNR